MKFGQGAGEWEWGQDEGYGNGMWEQEWGMIGSMGKGKGFLGMEEKGIRAKEKGGNRSTKPGNPKLAARGIT